MLRTTIFVVLLTGCQHAPTPSYRGVSVLPPVTVGNVGKDLAASVKQDMSKGVAPDVKVKQVKATPCNPQSMDPGPDQIVCASKLARGAGASHALLGTLGGVEKIFVLQLKLIDVEREAVVRSLEETLFASSPDRNQKTALLARRTLNLPEPRPWYTRWWLWTGVAVAAVAATVLPLALRDNDPFIDQPLPTR